MLLWMQTKKIINKVSRKSIYFFLNAQSLLLFQHSTYLNFLSQKHNKICQKYNIYFHDLWSLKTSLGSNKMQFLTS